MPQHEIKICSRCGKTFECKVGSILECQCNQIQLNTDERTYIEIKYGDCMCIHCLFELQQEFGLLNIMG